VYSVSYERHYEIKEDTVLYKDEHRKAEELNTKEIKLKYQAYK